MDGVTHVPRSRQGTFQLVIPSKDIRTLLSLPLEHSYPQVAIRTINFRLNLILIFHPWRTAFQEDGKTSMSRMFVLRIKKQYQFYSLCFFVCQLVFKGTVTKKLVLSEKNRSAFPTTVNIRRNKFYSSN